MQLNCYRFRAVQKTARPFSFCFMKTEPRKPSSRFQASGGFERKVNLDTSVVKTNTMKHLGPNHCPRGSDGLCCLLHRCSKR